MKRAAKVRHSVLILAGAPVLRGGAPLLPAEYLRVIIGIIKSDKTCDFYDRKVGAGEIFHAFFDAVAGDKIKEGDLHIFFKQPGAFTGADMD